jgi:glycosyltransferase involved in cell wall biosynthesis
MQEMLLDEGIDESKIKLIPHPVDINRFEYSGISKGEIGRLKAETRHFIFYTVGELVSRKNYEGLLRAWHSQFSKFDNVELVIKTHKSGMSSEECRKRLLSLNEEIKYNLRVNSRYVKDPIIYTENWTDDQIDELHREADCFVSTSHAEAFCIPALDALLFSKLCIFPSHTGFLDYSLYNNILLINSYQTNCYGCLDSLPEYYHPTNSWYDVDIGNLMWLMDTVKESYPVILQKEELFAEYSYEAVGNKVQKLLES